MYTWISNIFVLCLKEIKSLFSDLVLVALMIYFFTVAVVVASRGAGMEVKNAPVAVVDHDRSELSRAIVQSVRPPFFKLPEYIETDEVQRHMDLGDYYFVIDIPPNYQEKMLRGDNPKIQLLVDATAMTLAGSGTGYITRMISDGIDRKSVV